MSTTVSVEQTIQEWGNGLGVRITAPIARAARFSRGLPIKVEVVEGGVSCVRWASRSSRWRGEVMATGRVGAEVF
jgi:antitoxin component of MazEF toxin-antitoxin module